MRVASIVVLTALVALVGAGLPVADQPTAAWASPLSGPGSQQTAAYVVQPGDCLYLIAQRFGTTVRAIVAANNIADANLIYVGQRLAIPTTGGAGPQPLSSAGAPQGDESSVAGAALGASVTVAGEAAASKETPVASMTEMETALFQAVNAQRIAAGLPALSFEPALVDIARARSSDMATRSYFSHTTPEGGTVQDLIAAVGQRYALANEILARTNYPDDQAVSVSINAFMNSSAHRQHILLSTYARGAVGEARTPEGMKYFTVMLASAN